MNDTRNAQPVARPTSISRARRNGHASVVRSSSVSRASSSRDRGPATWSVANARGDVRDDGVGRQPGPQQAQRPPLVQRRRQDQEGRRPEARDRRVHLDPAALVGEDRVDDPPDLDVDVRRREPLQAGQRPGTLDEELRVGREVVQRDAVARRLDLGAHGREPRRRRGSRSRSRGRGRRARSTGAAPSRRPGRRPPRPRDTRRAAGGAAGRAPSWAACPASACRRGCRATRPCAPGATAAATPTTRFGRRRPRRGPSSGGRRGSTAAAARPTPGPKMIPCEFRPAATNSPGTSGSGPSWKFASGVNDSGARRKCSNPSPSRPGIRRLACPSTGAMWSQSGPSSANPPVVMPAGASGRPSGSNAPITSRPR